MGKPVDVEAMFVQDWSEDGQPYCIACDCITPKAINGHEPDCPIHKVRQLAKENIALFESWSKLEKMLQASCRATQKAEAEVERLKGDISAHISCMNRIREATNDTT